MPKKHKGIVGQIQEEDISMKALDSSVPRNFLGVFLKGVAMGGYSLGP